jgi:uncharacterized protein YutE (UPF0331/DUF86 family)
MSPLDREIIQRKLSIIVENLKALEPIQRLQPDEYIRDLYRRKATERLLQEMIEAAVDINTHLIVESGAAAPEDYYQSFIRAGEIGVLSPDLALKLAPSAGLRNRIIHEYNGIDHSIILKSVTMAEESYPAYVKEISEALSRSEESANQE